MAHELSNSNGRAAMAYYGETPWHGLGTRLDSPATAAEAMTAAQLNYEVELQSLQTVEQILVPKKKGVVRTDSKQILGVVGNSYRPIQNSECFSFLDSLVQSDDLRYHTAGALGKGERVWMLAKLPGYIRVNSTEDITEKFLLLSNSHDGSSALRVYFTPIRVVCANTLGAAERRSKGQGVTITHKGDLAAKVREAQTILGIADRFFQEIQTGVNRMASYQPTADQVRKLFYAISPDPIEGHNARATNVRQDLARLFEEGKGQQIPGVRHTAWAAFNAITEYIDHHRPVRSKNIAEKKSRRLESIWFGDGANLKSAAWDLTLMMTTSA